MPMATDALQRIRAARDESKEGMEKSLRQGSKVSSAVLSADVLDGGSFWVLAPTGFVRRPLELAVGGVAHHTLAQHSLGRFFDESKREGAGCIVVEDDLRRIADPPAGQDVGPSAFVGNRLLHWCELKNGGQACAAHVSKTAFGYPLNAFVVRKDPAHLGLKDRQQAPDRVAELIVRSLAAVVVAAFDNESFLIWTDQP